MDDIVWIKTYRSFMNSWLWTVKEPFDKRSAWLDMLMSAFFTDEERFFNGVKILVTRGQFPTSVRLLAERWSWSISKVNRYLKRLETEKMIITERIKIETTSGTGAEQERNTNRNTNRNTERNTYGTLITVVNYAFYQDEKNDSETPSETPTETQSGTPTEQERNTNECNSGTGAVHIKRNKEDKESKKRDDKYSAETKQVAKRIIDYLNDKCGTRYRSTTDNTIKSINARISDGYTEDDFYIVIDKKCGEWIGTEWEKYLRPDTLFRPSNFESYVNQKVTKQKGKKEDINASRQSQLDYLLNSIKEAEQNE